MNKRIKTEDLDKKFNDLLSENRVNINTIENLMIDEIEEYKKELKFHIEELLINKLNEKDLINKKNEKC